jgi:hypothetical protein
MQNSILPILKKNKLIGTGFCIYYSKEEQKSYILTCHHVLEGQKEFEIQGEKPEIIIHNECYDMSIVTISTEVKPLKLVEDELVDEAMLYNLQEYSSGCIGEEVEGRVCEDIIPATQHRCNKIIESQRLEIIDNKAVIKKGNSGSPVFCKKTKRVVAMANIKYDMQKAEKVFALKISYLKAIWQEIPFNLISVETSDNKRMVMSEILDTLPMQSKKETPSSINQIFLIFNQDNTTDNQYEVIGHIQAEDEFENELIEFTFTNIYDEVEQELFIQNLVDEFDDSITIHFIIPPELFLVNFKQWRYRGNSLVNRYHILLHNKERYNSKSRKYKSMIDSWQVLFNRQKEKRLSEALLITNDSHIQFDTRLDKMGVCFKQSCLSYEVVNNTLDMAKVGLWQCDDGVIEDYHRWVEGSLCLKELNQASRKCDHIALLWDDMSLLEELKRRK